MSKRKQLANKYTGAIWQLASAQVRFRIQSRLPYMSHETRTYLKQISILSGKAIKSVQQDYQQAKRRA